MAIETSFTIKQVNVDEALKQAENKAARSAKNIDKSLNKSSGTANKMTQSLNAGLKTANGLGAKLGGTLKNAFGGLVSGGIWGAVISGVMIGVQKIYEVWQNMTLSLEQSLQLTKDKLAAAEKDSAKTQADINKYEPYVKSLKELNDMENKTASTYTQMITLIQMLQDRYGDLGIKINKATGEVIGLDEALQRLRDRQYKETVTTKKRQMDLAKEQVQKLALDADYKTYMKGAKTNKYTGQQRGGKKTVRFSKISLQGLDAELEKNASNPQQYKKIKELRDAYAQYLAKKKAYSEAKDVRPWMNDNVPLAMQLNAREKQLKELEKQYASIKKQGEMSRKAGSGPDRQYRLLRLRLQAEQEKTDRAKENISDLLFPVDYLQRQLAPLREKQKNGNLSTDQSKELIRLQKELLTFKNAIAEQESKVKIHLIAQEKLKQQIAEIERQREQKIEDMLTADKQQVEVIALQLYGRYEQAAILKRINELKKQGITDEKKQKEIIESENKLKELSTKKTLQDELKQMRNSLTPKTKENEFKRRKQQLERQSGKNLTAEQEQMLKRNIELKFNMQDLEKLKLNLSNLDIRTNELTARGGFQTGAVTADLGVINSQIRDYAAMQVRLLQRMDSKLNTNGGGY